MNTPRIQSVTARRVEAMAFTGSESVTPRRTQSVTPARIARLNRADQARLDRLQVRIEASETVTRRLRERMHQLMARLSRRRHRQTSRRRWTAPNNPTPQARAVWAACFPREDWPHGWRVQWAGFMRGALGLLIRSERRILLSYGDAKRAQPGYGVVDTLLHEFVHLRAKGLRHGQEFRELENNLRARIGLDLLPPTQRRGAQSVTSTEPAGV